METRGEKTPRPRPNLRGTPEYPRGTPGGTPLCTPGPAYTRVPQGTAGCLGVPRGTPVRPFVDLLLLTNVYLCAPLANFIFFSLHKQPACNYLRTVCLGRVAFGAWCDTKWEKMAYKISPRASARPKSTTCCSQPVLLRFVVYVVFVVLARVL